MRVNPRHVQTLLRLRKGDKIRVNTRKLRKPRVLTVLSKPEKPSNSQAISVYVASGAVRPGHRAGGVLTYRPEDAPGGEELTYQATMLQPVQDVTDLEKISEATAEKLLMATKRGTTTMSLHEKIAQQWMEKQAGHAIETVRGHGWTQDEAFRDATSESVTGFADETVSEVIKVKRVKAPKPAKRVKIEKSKVTKGKVEKAYVIEKYWGSGFDPIDRDRMFNARYKTQGEVLKAAKVLALKYQVELVIKLAAFCQGDTHLAKVIPERGEMGVWDFKIDFHI